MDREKIGKNEFLSIGKLKHEIEAVRERLIKHLIMYKTVERERDGETKTEKQTEIGKS